MSAGFEMLLGLILKPESNRKCLFYRSKLLSPSHQRHAQARSNSSNIDLSLFEIPLLHD